MIRGLIVRRIVFTAGVFFALAMGALGGRFLADERAAAENVEGWDNKSFYDTT